MDHKFKAIPGKVQETPSQKQDTKQKNYEWLKW
jgi:hypothetical protein